MTKQPHSATKLRLSKLFRWLAVLCFMKLIILGLLLLDVPAPSWLGGTAKKETTVAVTNAPASKAVAEAPAPAIVEEAAPSGLAQSVSSTLSSMGSALDAVVDNIKDKAAPQKDPQGSAAARMAAATKPHADQTGGLPDAALPAPLIHAAAPGGANPMAEVAKAASQTFSPNFPQPQALPAPQAEPGTPAPSNSLIVSAKPNRASESEWLDALGLSHLPIPGLGSVQAAHAAALDMPVPQTPSGGQSPFAPAEQTAPLSMPGAPPIPANIPRGQSMDGAPLPPRGAAGGTEGFVPSLPQGSNTGSLPTPTVQQPQNAYANDPNSKAQELARQQQDILVLRQQMDQRLKDIQATEKKMQDMIREAKGIENEKIHRLVLTYSMMKPKAAAKALESMDERVAIRILSGMTPKQSGEILTYVAPAKTAKLTELITRMRIPD